MVYKKSSPRPSAIRHMPYARLRRGFTLVEILVTVAIISILTTLVVTVISRMQANGRDAKRISDLNNLSSALENFYADKLDLPGSGGALYRSDFAPGGGTLGACNGTGWIDENICDYINVLPIDPQNSPTSYYRYQYTVAQYELDAPIEVSPQAANDGGDNSGRYEVGTNLFIIIN